MTKSYRPSHRFLVVAGVAAALAGGPAVGAATAAPAAAASHPISYGAAGTVPVAKRAAAEIAQKFSVSGIGGKRAGSGTSDHHTGRAIDIPATGAKGDRIAAWVKQNAGRLGVKYVIWEQRYWEPGMSGSGRLMEDRGSATQNHYDHVHISF